MCVAANPRSTTALTMSSSSWADSANSSERGMVWMMSSNSWPRVAGLALRIAPKRPELAVKSEGISSTLALVAATVNRPTNRCSYGSGSRFFADHDDVGVCAVAEVAGDGGLGEHEQFVARG